MPGRGVVTGGARLGLVILAVGDLPRASTFYRSVFGRMAVIDTPVYSEFELPAGMRLGLYERGAFARAVDGNVIALARPSGR